MSSHIQAFFGPTEGDPVNVALGEEEYTPPADLFVYNPIGPSVTWGRIYNSLRGHDNVHNFDDFGYSWSQPFNFGIYDPDFLSNPQYVAGQINRTIFNGNDAPAAGLNWDIVRNGVTIASSTTPNGWSPNLAYSWFDLSIPLSAASGTDYELRYAGGRDRSTGNVSLLFDVVPQGIIPQAGVVLFPATGTDRPPSNVYWAVQLNGVGVASSSQPNGWNVVTQFQSPGIQVTCSTQAAIGAGYEVEVSNPQYGGSATFAVIASRMHTTLGTKYLYFPNGARAPITPAAIPSAQQPRVVCTVPGGIPYQVEWDYDTTSPFGHYMITMPDRTIWKTSVTAKSINAQQDNTMVANTFGFCYVPIQQTDRNGNSINLVYGNSGPSGFPLLSGITDSNGSVLLSFQRKSDGSGNLVFVLDRYGRKVFYNTSDYATVNSPIPFFRELDHVSMIALSGDNTAPDRYIYGYQNVTNLEVGEQVPFLHTISVPAPDGSQSNATATINYDPSTDFVSSVVDANGNKHAYTAVDANHTKITIETSQNIVALAYTVGFDMNMSGTTVTDGTNTNIIETREYSDPNDPYRPSSITDGNGHTSYFTWDRFGHLQTKTSPRQTVLAYTWDYSLFPMGELKKVQVGNRAPSFLNYLEPSGLLSSIVVPKPGTIGGTNTVTSSFTYDALGNVLTETSPGNNAAAAITATYNYTQDGAYNQSESLGLPLTVTDNLGKVSHFRYDVQGRCIAAIDPLNHETDYTFNIADQVTQASYPATGQTGPGHANAQYGYLYIGGPVNFVGVYNESNTLVRHVTPVYGLEGETRSATGDVFGSQVLFDAAYRPVAVYDGKNNPTLYSYNTTGQLVSMTYTDGNAVNFTAFNPGGQPLTRIDARGIESDYVYNDPCGRITDVVHPANPSVDIHIVYDRYGRTTSQADGAGTVAYGYDDTNRYTNVTTTYTGLPAQTLSYN